MSSYVNKALLPGERVVYAATLHWIIYVQGLIFTIAAGVAGHYLPVFLISTVGIDAEQHLIQPLTLVDAGVLLVGLMLLLGAYIRQKATELAITNMRIIAKYGFISRNTYEIMLNRVTGANFDQTIMGRILGYGTIIVHGAGGDISPIDYIADPPAFHNHLMALIERAQQSRAPAQGR